jgi:hypothetical protein
MRAFLFAIFAITATSAFADVTYQVTADTSSIVGSSGYLDLQFEPNPVVTNPATAAVTKFATSGTLSGAATLTGDVTGQLPGALSFDNLTSFNDYFQATTFGNTLSFDVTLAGPTPQGGAASAFNIAFYAADGATPILTTDTTNGIAGDIILNGDGSTSADAIPATAGGASVLTISLVSATPEPSYTFLLAIAGGGVILMRRRLRKD